jgi:hypothetical protein
MARRKTAAPAEAPRVPGTCEKCNTQGLVGREILPWSTAPKKTEWLCRRCKHGG